MTREEKQKAIDALKISVPIKALTQEEFNDYIQTLNKVMDWLEQEPTTKNNLGVDCISRKVVIDELKRYFHDEYYQRTSIQDCRDCFIEDVLNHLPSVTPQEPKIVTIAEDKYDEDKLKELVNKAVLTVTPQEPQTFKWCETCKEYDQEKHCCHRWSKVIRDTVEEMKQEYIEREVLDKIRAEIIELRSKQNVGVLECLDIIDKYKTESEEKE